MSTKPDTIKWTGYLVIAVNKGKPYPYSGSTRHPWEWKVSARMTVNKPSLGKDEVPVKVTVELPASLFLQPTVEARISVPDTAAAPLSVDMAVQDNIAEIIRQQTGFDVRIVNEQPPTD